MGDGLAALLRQPHGRLVGAGGGGLCRKRSSVRRQGTVSSLRFGLPLSAIQVRHGQAHGFDDSAKVAGSRLQFAMLVADKGGYRDARLRGELPEGHAGCPAGSQERLSNDLRIVAVPLPRSRSFRANFHEFDGVPPFGS
jgi:hypothetical protein